MTAQTLGKTRAIQTRVTDQEGEKLDLIAQSEGCSVADLARRALRQVFPQAFSLPRDGTISAETARALHTNQQRPDAASVTDKEVTR